MPASPNRTGRTDWLSPSKGWPEAVAAAPVAVAAGHTATIATDR
jgi:hypothetical protein